MCRIALIAAAVIALPVGAAVAQVPETPSPAQTLLQQPSVEMPADEGLTIRHPGWYAAGGVLVAPPMLFDATDSKPFSTLAPIPAPWATLGFRRANDVSWQTSFLLVPLHAPHNSFFENPMLSTVGLDVDRISTNRSANPEWDLRWQVGLRIVGVGVDYMPLPLAIGPHVGLRWEHPLQGGLSVYGWGDVGVLPSLFEGIPLVDLRGELGFTWRPVKRPGLSFSVAAFNECAGIVVAGFMTPGIKFRLAWNF
jgi:hypothetical protein